MLFDLQGKRRRVVQVTYLGLAILMGGGLVLFGIGGDVSGGLFDAFSDRSGGSGNEIVEERIDRNEERVKANPRSEAARKELVRDYYQMAASEASASTGSFPPEAREELQAAARNWAAYLALEPERPDSSLARVAIQLYDPVGLDRPKLALEAARIVAEQEDNTNSYLQLAQSAMLAGDKRIEKLASARAVDLAPPKQRKAVRAQLKQIRQAIVLQQLEESGVDLESLQQQGGQGGSGGGGSGGGGSGGGEGSGGGAP